MVSIFGIVISLLIGLVVIVGLVTTARFIIPVLGVLLLAIPAGVIGFFESKSPVKWIAAPVWLVGVWLIWEYKVTETEWVCPNAQINGTWGECSEVLKNTLGESIFITILLGGFWTICVSIAAVVLDEKLRFHYKHTKPDR